MPEGVTGSERLSGGMNIPPVAPDPAKLDPAPKCLDQPPAYFAPKAVVAGSVEEAVNVWGSAWANRKPDQVASFYSPPASLDRSHPSSPTPPPSRSPGWQ